MDPTVRQDGNNLSSGDPQHELVVTMEHDESSVGGLTGQHAYEPGIKSPATNLQNSAITACEPALNTNPPVTPSTLKSSRWCWPQQHSTSVTSPLLFSNRKKTLILIIVATASSTSSIATSIYYPALVIMQQYFSTDDTTINASISVFTFFTAFFPLMWGTFADAFGRRRVYIISFLITVIGSVCCALSVNVTMLIVFRGVSAIGSSSVMSIGAGTLADIYEPHERGRAFAWYTCGPLLGPALGPIIGGYLTQGLGWRSTFWFLAIFVFCVWVTIILFLPETWRPAHTSEGLHEVHPTSEKPKIEKIQRRWINPLSSLRILKFSNIVLSVFYVGFIFVVLFINNTSFTRTYTIQYGLDTGTVGLCYLASAAGSIVGANISGRCSDLVYNKRVKESEEEPYAEMRLGGPALYVAAFMQLFAYVSYGWCVQENVHWAFGLVFQFFIGISNMIPVVILIIYNVDCFRKQSASVAACNNFVRYIMASIGALISPSLQNALGSGPLFTICGGVLFVAFINIIYIKKKSAKWIQQRKTCNS